MRVRFSLAVAALGAMGGTGWGAVAGIGSRQEVPLAFVNVNLVSMLADRVIPDQTVLVEGDRITAVGPRGEVHVPSDARVIQGSGRYLVPALADMHVHLEYFEDPVILRQLVAQGITLVRNMDGRPYILDWRDRTASGVLLGPRIVTAGPILDGDPPLRDDNIALGSAEAARDAVRRQGNAGYDFVKVYTNLGRDAYYAVIDEARARRLPVAGHVPRGLGAQEVMTAGQGSIEHLDGYDELVEADDSPYHGRWHWSKLYLAMPFDAVRAEAAARATAAAGTWNVPTLIVNEKLAPLSTVRLWLEDPVLAYVPADVRAAWAPEGRDPYQLATVERMEAEDWALLAKGRSNRLAVVRALNQAGAGLLAGSDTPNPFVVPGVALHEELVLMQEAGLTPYEALSTATRNGAAFLGETDEWGIVAPGARADLLLLAANPLEDVANTRRIEGIVLRGRWLPQHVLEAIRREVREAYELP